MLSDLWWKFRAVFAIVLGFPCILQLTAWRCRSSDFKELEIIVLRHKLDILRRQTRRTAVTTVETAWRL